MTTKWRKSSRKSLGIFFILLFIYLFIFLHALFKWYWPWRCHGFPLTSAHRRLTAVQRVKWMVSFWNGHNVWLMSTMTTNLICMLLSLFLPLPMGKDISRSKANHGWILHLFPQLSFKIRGKEKQKMETEEGQQTVCICEEREYFSLSS